MLSDGERSDEDSRLEESTANGEAKAEPAQPAKVNGNPDDGDESSMASTTKDVKESKDRESGKSKTKKKKKGAAYHRLRDFRKSKGYDLFTAETTSMSPPPEDVTEEEVVTHVIGKKPLLGKVWKDKTSGDYVRYRCYSYGIEYKIGDPVYIESQRPEQPFYICCIHDFKMSKKETLSVHIKWFYRTNEVPEQVYQLLVKDRHTEHKTFHKSLALAEKAANEASNGVAANGDAKKTKRPKLDDRMLRMRELFVSEATDVYPVSVLRGKCTVYHCNDISAVKKFTPDENTFFFTLSYNPETRRLASTQGEIRVGASHQAKCPEYTPDIPTEDRSDPDDYEEMTWEPSRIHDHDLLMYLRAGRSMAAFAAMCDGETPEDGFVVASRDGIALNAIQLLHEASYDTGKALQGLLKTPFPVDGGADPSRRWPEEDVKEFIKGLRLYGKNFFKIRQEFLPHRDTPELVEFYYLWKKTPGAANNRPRGRRPRPGVIKRFKGGKSGTGKSNRNEDDPDDLSSCSEEPDEANENGDENGDLSPYYCRHCYTTSSRDWHHAGPAKLLVCLECRLYFKKYGELPCLEPPNEETEEFSTDEEEEEIKPPTDKKLDLNAIEQDSNENYNAAVNGNTNGTTSSEPNNSEPVEIKGELPKSIGLVSPVPTMPAHVSHPAAQSIHPHLTHAQVMPPANLMPGPPPAHSNSEVQVLSRPSPNPPHHHQQPQQQQQQQPTAPREPSPPPKPDGSECHRSQSAIFTRQWNRGEGNSCARTDLYFKPVPDSNLARKRQERLRKAQNERDDAIKAAQAQEQAKHARLEMNANPFDPFSRQTPSNLPPGLAGLPGMPGPSGFGPMSELERLERERRAQAEAAMASALAAASPSRSPYPNPPGTPVPVSMSAGFGSHLSGLEDRRRLEAAMVAERQYVERMGALASTDPLVRLQMAGLNPELPHSLHPAYASLAAMAGNPLAGGPRLPPAFDPRFRLPGADILSRPQPGFSPRAPMPPGADQLQLRMMMEQEHHRLRAASAAASASQHASLMAQQEEFFRQASVSRQ